MKEFIRCYWVSLLVMFVAFVVTILLPEDKRIQVAAPLVVGFVMFKLHSLLMVPYVVIEDLSDEADYSIGQGFPHELSIFVRGTVTNKSSTGSGEIRDLVLRITMSPEEDIEVPIHEGEPRIIGFRVQPNGILPEKNLCFMRVGFPYPVDESTLSGKSAVICLSVMGQKLRSYRIRLKTK